MLWSLILYILLLLFAIKMILRLAPRAPAPRRLEYTPTQLPAFEQTAFDFYIEQDAQAEKELVNA